MHRRIIGFAPAGRGRLYGWLAVLLVGALLATRPALAARADPTIEAGRVATLQRAAIDAKRALDDLIRQLQAAIDAGRSGSALIVDGDEDPGPAFDSAADAARSAMPLAIEAAEATSRVTGMLAAVEPSLGPLPVDAVGSMAGIADQLTAAGHAGGPFVQRRLAAEATLASLADALQALDRDDPRVALSALDRAAASHATVADWPEPPRVLPFWLDTTRAMIGAARGIARATIAEDPRAAARSVRAYRRAAEDARRADTALALAVSEAGSSLAATPMRRLADAMAASLAQHQALRTIEGAAT